MKTLTLPQTSTWADSTSVPTAPPDALEKIMMADDKIYVVLAVVLIIWFGILWYLYRTDAKIAKLEKEFTQN